MLAYKGDQNKEANIWHLYTGASTHMSNEGTCSWNLINTHTHTHIIYLSIYIYTLLVVI